MLPYIVHFTIWTSYLVQPIDTYFDAEISKRIKDSTIFAAIAQ